MVEEAGKQSLPGWSLAREGPKRAKKQGWECPAPTVEDWEDYKQWKEQQERKDELPAATQVFLADRSLLFYQDPDVQLPWIHRIKCELPRRVGRLSGELPVKAAYVGVGVGQEGYDSFVKAMAQIGVVLCRRIQLPPTRFELAHLEQSDLVMVEGSDRRELWRLLGSELESSAVAEHVKWRYLQGAVIVAVGAAMSLLGEKAWYTLEKGGVVGYKAWRLFPHVVALEDGEEDNEELVTALGGAGVVVLGVHPGCGMIFNKDGLLEPVKGMVQEYRWDWQSESVKEALLLGPPRGTGLICPLYAAMQRGGSDEEEAEDVFAYALTEQEEAEEESLWCLASGEVFLAAGEKKEVEELKAEGNAAFKAGLTDAAALKYGQAVAVLRSAQKAQRAEGDEAASPVLTAILLNQCACYLLAHSQDERKKREGGDEVAGTEETTLMEARNNLVSAFRSANEALRITQGRNAKAWYRRGTAFEGMGDVKNAERDYEEALKRAPGDKEITRRLAEVKERAGKVAEEMYWARHKELDEQEQRLNLPSREELHLRGGEAPLAVETDEEGKTKAGAAYLHPQALWTWEFMLQRAASLRVLNIADVDIGSGPLEWLCKGLRSHQSLQTLRLAGIHAGAAGARSLRNALAQNGSLLEVALDSCALHDAGLDELSKGLGEHRGPLERLSLRKNYFSAKRLKGLGEALARCGVTELDLSGNPLGAEGARELGGVVGSEKLRVLRLQDCQIELSGFWRLVTCLDDNRPLATLDLTANPIGRGTRRCWRGQMGPKIRCEVLLSESPARALREARAAEEEGSRAGYPLPGKWV